MKDMIPIDAEINEFKEHLKRQDRVIFSAKFGDGKSYFLDRFKKRLKNQYLFLTIYPVNYPVSENKDIIEYIKRDIILQLFANADIVFDDDDLPTKLLVQQYCLNNAGTITKDILSCIPYLKNSVKDISVLLGHIKKFKKYEDEIKSENESQKLDDYLDTMSEEKGSIYEFDAITQIITNLIDGYRQKNTRRKVVLIIEDLDRIDPGHIFRILNVFSAHIDNFYKLIAKGDQKTHPNKFGIDKVITVCDYYNIQCIFHHLYGDKTNFKGYIDKFKSGIPFRYSLRDKFIEYITERIDNSIKERPIILEKICALIVAKYDTKDDGGVDGSSLREIDRILKINLTDRINDELIYVSNGEYYISSCNNLTKMLALLHCFGIESEAFIGWLTERLRLGDNNRSELKDVISFMDITLLISSRFSICFGINGNNSEYLRLPAHGDGNLIPVKTWYNKADDKHIKALNINIESISTRNICEISHKDAPEILATLSRYIHK